MEIVQSGDWLFKQSGGWIPVDSGIRDDSEDPDPQRSKVGCRLGKLRK